MVTETKWRSPTIRLQQQVLCPYNFGQLFAPLVVSSRTLLGLVRHVHGTLSASVGVVIACIAGIIAGADAAGSGARHVARTYLQALLAGGDAADWSGGIKGRRS